MSLLVVLALPVLGATHQPVAMSETVTPERARANFSRPQSWAENLYHFAQRLFR
ncbi:hypothetical protein [Ideonella sp. YS5]|uniref:hypothetical protein n=1 Tax=Ideonella sp. YS5 TaxID=3453714 RepID=UPI003EEDFAEB